MFTTCRPWTGIVSYQLISLINSPDTAPLCNPTNMVIIEHQFVVTPGAPFTKKFLDCFWNRYRYEIFHLLNGICLFMHIWNRLTYVKNRSLHSIFMRGRFFLVSFASRYIKLSVDAAQSIQGLSSCGSYQSPAFYRMAYSWDCVLGGRIKLMTILLAKITAWKKYYNHTFVACNYV